MKLFSRTRQLLIPTEPERSLALRMVILAAMLVPLVAIARVSTLLPHVLAAAAGICLGHWYSYYNLDRRQQLVRAIMFIAIHIALVWMLVGLGRGATVPQAQFAIFAQAITSFDLRYRRSLFNTLVHSLANLYVAASLSRTSELGLYLLLFAGLVLGAFFVAGREDGLKQARLRPAGQPGHFRAGLIFGGSFALAALLAIFIIFLFTPRFASRPIVPPFTINAPLRGGIKSEIINPGVPVVQINGWSDDTSDYYYGFDTNLDLRYRGGLSDELVMYVRSPSHSYWRSHSYDFYTGVSWAQSDPTLREVRNRGGMYFELFPPLGSPPAQGSSPNRPAEATHHEEELLGRDVLPPGVDPTEQQIVQSFTMVRDQPNLIFAAYRPGELFILTEHLSVDSGDGIRLPEPLRAGLTYSVISYRPNFEPDLLRRASRNYPPEIAARYLQLPDNISARVRRLAGDLTAPYSNDYDKVMALTDHLLKRYPYNYFPPPHPPGAEVVDTFLFEDQEGVCEQFVTALVVLARTQGIPARLASGYGAGDYNPLTGYYEVRLNHAHSWAEVYFPEYGWVPFDPTPGWLPQPYPTPVQTWLFSPNGAIPGLNLPVSDLVAGGVVGLAALGPALAGLVLLVGLGVVVAWLARRLRWSGWRPTRLRYTPAGPDPARQAILSLYRRGLAVLARQKRSRRQPWETLDEYARRQGNLPALFRLTRAAEIAAYRPETPGEETITEARQALANLKEELKGESDS